MNKKDIFDAVYKNKVLILCCLVLIFGAIIGISVLKLIPEKVCENLYFISSGKNIVFFNEFLNRFCFPAIIITIIFFSGFSLFGRFTSLLALFLYGTFFIFDSGIKYMFLGMDYFTEYLVRYITITLFAGFALIIMAESSFFSSIKIKNIINEKNTEKPHFKAKNTTVKFIAFTSVLAVFSVFSAFFSLILQDFL